MTNNLILQKDYSKYPNVYQLRIASETGQLVGKLEELGEIKYEHLFVDCTKIEANANKYSFVWKKSTDRYQGKLKEKIEKLKNELKDIYGYDFDENIDFVHGRGSKKTALQRYTEQLNEYIQKQEKYER